MSCVVDFAETSFNTTNIVAGFDIMGPDSSESITQDSASNEMVARGTIQDLMGNSSRFDFVGSEAIEEDQNLGLENEAIVDDIDSESIEAIDSGETLSDISGKDIFALEFFNDDLDLDPEFIAGESKIAIGSVSDDTDPQNDEISVKLSIDGQELAQFDVELSFQDDRYDIF